MPHALRQLSHNTQLAVLRLVMRLLPGPRPPLLFSGPGSALQMCDTLAELGTQRLLVVTDAVLMRLGVVDPLLEALRSRGVHCTVYDGVEPDPTHAQVEAGIALALREGSEAVLAVALELLVAGVLEPMVAVEDFLALYSMVFQELLQLSQANKVM